MNNNLRLGFTETSLLFFYYLDEKNIFNEKYISKQNNLINWLYSTSGFYDKEIQGSYFNFDAEKIKHSKIYNEYFKELLFFLKDNNHSQLQLCYHELDNTLKPYKEEFEKFIKLNNSTPLTLFDFMENKNILIINNLGSLMKKQFESGNIRKIHKNFPNNIKSIQYFENGYTFFNNGPDSSILETTDKICNQIQKYNFDGAIVSAGAYSCLIAKFIILIEIY